MKVPSSKLKLFSHGKFLAEHLKNGCKDVKTDLLIQCIDGNVHLHKVILGAKMVSSSLLRALKSSSVENETLTIIIPEVKRKFVQHLRNLLYTGETEEISEKEIKELNEVSDLLKISSLTLSLVERTDVKTEEPQRNELSIEVVEPPRKRIVKVKQPTFLEEDSNLIRRSKRPKVKNKNLDDFEIPLKGTRVADNQSAENHSSEQHISRFSNAASSCDNEHNHEVNDDTVAQPVKSREAADYNWRDNFNVDVVYKVCYICRQKFLGLHQLTKHLRLHREIDFDCLVCSKKLPSGFLLHEHMRYHYNTKEITTETETNKTGHNSSTGSYKCQFCPQLQFVTAKNFSDHMLQVHNQKPFQCSDCSVAYMHKSNLEDHIKAKHVSGEPDIPCDKCGKMFRTKTSLFVHRREQHILGDSRKVKCDICNRLYKGLRNLKKHKEVHIDEAYKKFPCLYCNRTFRTKNSLTVHERIHTGETPYICHLCSKNFKRSHHLWNHLKSADHTSKLNQLEVDGKSPPDPIYTIAKMEADFSNLVSTVPNVGGGNFTGPIYMEMTDANGSKSVQVVVPGEALEASGTMTTDQLLQSAVLLASTEDYQEFVTN